jgi:hypothetical protein
MGPVTALDFTEQLMIFDSKWGMIYDNPEFVQASQVREFYFSVHESRVCTDLILASWASSHHVGEVRGVERSLVADEGGLDFGSYRHGSGGLYDCGIVIWWASIALKINGLQFSDNLS